MIYSEAYTRSDPCPPLPPGGSVLPYMDHKGCAAEKDVVFKSLNVGPGIQI